MTWKELDEALAAVNLPDSAVRYYRVSKRGRREIRPTIDPGEHCSWNVSGLRGDIAPFLTDANGRGITGESEALVFEDWEDLHGRWYPDDHPGEEPPDDVEYLITRVYATKRGVVVECRG